MHLARDRRAFGRARLGDAPALLGFGAQGPFVEGDEHGVAARGERAEPDDGDVREHRQRQPPAVGQPVGRPPAAAQGVGRDTGHGDGDRVAPRP